MISAQKVALINEVRSCATELLRQLERFQGVKRRYDSFDAGNTILNGDFTESNSGITAAQFVSCVGSLDAINGFVAANNHDDVIYHLVK